MKIVIIVKTDDGEIKKYNDKREDSLRQSNKDFQIFQMQLNVKNAIECKDTTSKDSNRMFSINH